MISKWRDSTSGFGIPGAMPVSRATLEPVTLLVSGTTGTDSPELTEHSVKTLLNQSTMEKFGSTSDQIIIWANKSMNKKDGRTLLQVIRIVFEKAVYKTARSEIYARLCWKGISPEVQDSGIRDTESKLIIGGQLLREYFLDRYREDSERRFVAKETTIAVAVNKADDQAIKATNEKEGDESKLYSDECHAAPKAKR